MLLLRGAREYNVRRDFVYSTVFEVIFLIGGGRSGRRHGGVGVAGWVVMEDYDGVCVGEECAFVDFAGVDE